MVFQNELLQLIQYAPATQTVHKRPLLIVPPWINKYYILDLRPRNSFVAWCVAQGYTVFMVSWVNPDERHRDRSFDDYLQGGIFAALDAIEEATGEREVNAIGYCIGGTLLAIALAWMGARGETRIRAATFFAAQVDFADGGELRVFTDASTLKLVEGEVERQGFLDGASMAAAFNLLRSNDLVWHYAVESYLMGKTPRAFDLLYWNADSTRFPARLFFDYLRGMYQENRLATPGAFEVLGQPIDLADVRIPVYLQASRQDHIAPAASVLQGDEPLLRSPALRPRRVRAHRGGGQSAGPGQVPALDPPRAPAAPVATTSGSRARRSIPAPGGPTGTAGCRGARDAGWRRGCRAMAVSRRSSRPPAPTCGCDATGEPCRRRPLHRPPLPPRLRPP